MTGVGRGQCWRVRLGRGASESSKERVRVNGRGRSQKQSGKANLVEVGKLSGSQHTTQRPPCAQGGVERTCRLGS